jgi:hypothetical protein
MSPATSARDDKKERIDHPFQTIRIIATSAAVGMSAVFAIARLTGAA